MEMVKPLKQSMVEKFFMFVHERQKIWYKRFVLKEPYPWTDDKILQQYRFCNVYRELDKGTYLFIKRVKACNLNRKELLFNTVGYRLFNSITWLEEIFPLDLNFDFNEVYQKVRSLDKSVFHLAYITNPIPLVEENKSDKLYQHLSRLKYLSTVIDDWIERLDNSSIPEESFVVLKGIRGIGNFLAYEIWTDLTYFNFFKQGWTDNDFVNLGPGAVWGLALMSGKEKPTKELKEGYTGLGIKLVKWLRDTQEYWFTKLYKEEKISPRWIEIAYKKAFSNVPYLSLRNIEHSLCEFRKYYRLINGQGRKRKYKVEGGIKWC